jgi:hemerythrin
MPVDSAVAELSPLVWVSAFETGEPAIDDEHRALLMDINDLSELLTQEQGWPLIVDKSRKLRNSCFSHFDDEEVVLERAKYKRLRSHKTEHRLIRRQLGDILSFIESVAVPSRAQTEAVLLLRSILVNHFFRFDIGYKTHLLRLGGHGASRPRAPKT